MELRQEIKYICLAALLPLVFSIKWLLTNTQLPIADAANYLSTTVDIYRHFTDGGIWKGLHAVFFERGWRPIFFPNFAVIFLFLSKGNLHYLVTQYAVFALCLSVLYVYLFFRLQLNRFAAAIATSLIVFLPLIQVQALNFYAEALLFPCMIGGVYHLIQSRFLNDVKHTGFFIVLLSLSVVLRPVEAVSLWLPVFGIFLFSGWKRKLISTFEIFMAVLILIGSLLLFLIAASGYFFSKSMITLEDMKIVTFCIGLHFKLIP